jgi:hypothetical protein
MSKRKQDFKEYFSSEECFHNGEKLHIEELSSNDESHPYKKQCSKIVKQSTQKVLTSLTCHLLRIHKTFIKEKEKMQGTEFDDYEILLDYRYSSSEKVIFICESRAIEYFYFIRGTKKNTEERDIQNNTKRGENIQIWEFEIDGEIFTIMPYDNTYSEVFDENGDIVNYYQISELNRIRNKLIENKDEKIKGFDELSIIQLLCKYNIKKENSKIIEDSRHMMELYELAVKDTELYESLILNFQKFLFKVSTLNHNLIKFWILSKIFGKDIANFMLSEFFIDFCQAPLGQETVSDYPFFGIYL